MTPEQINETRERFVAVRVVKLCEICGAEMTPTGRALLALPPQFEHRCSRDGTHPAKTYLSAYPKIEYEKPVVMNEGGDASDA